MRDTEWKPSEEEIAWTKTNLEPLQVGGVWAPHGLEYERTGSNELKLVSMVNHEGVQEAHARISVVLDKIDWVLNDDSVKHITNQAPPEAVAANQEAELERIQAIVSGWICPDEKCEELLVNMPLEECAWVNHGPHEFTNPETGEEGEADRWLAHITCEKCSVEIPMNPMDYGYLGGEDLFYTWKVNKSLSYRVLTREQTVVLIDSGKEGIPLGSLIQGIEVPPHMQGTYCAIEITGDEEE